ncbi:hypothetical protein K504DRAFT_537405 [Pleomassaria siparia CBS 279.74]|uniref:Uncharacterized protein n=1 Tax=Pleomassaria siparia CBS 279.74 TaxID=1314801 RepID=A0A6G1JXX9_9PLEO|nr:hypothetical protein K504DRAFT_537405 [Pleomassaria siparia CBS 279.74]
MQSLRRTAVTTIRKGRTTLPRQSRRYAHDEHAHAPHTPPASEGFGKGFWGTIALIPLGWGLYFVSRPESADSPPLITRWINEYTSNQEKNAAINDLHVRIMDQVGSDRVLFQKTWQQEHIEMRFPEIMNVGSPFNVVAGSQVNMDKVIEKYQKLAYEDNEKKLEALRTNTIKGEQPYTYVYGVREKKD